jgi:hypothetical protein
MIGFIDTLYKHTTRRYKQYSAITDLHTFQFTVTHSLGISVSSSRILAKDLITGTITSNHYEIFLSFLSPWTSDFPELDPVLQFYLS